MPIKVFFNRLIAFSPSEIKTEDRQLLSDYSWKLQHVDGSTVDFVQSEDRVAVLNFWATWCPPCVAEMPSLQELYDVYGDRVDFYFVSSEENEVLEKFLQKKEYSFPVYKQSQQAPEILQSRSLPTTFVISKSGEVVMQKTGAANWNSTKVHEVLDGLLSE